MIEHKVSIRVVNNVVVIYINNINHLTFDRYEMMGFQSYIDRKYWWSKKMYTIEIYPKHNRPIICEYENRQLWKDILFHIDDIIIKK